MVKGIIMTEQTMTLETIVKEFTDALDVQGDVAEIEALEKDTDAKLLQLANGDQEVFLNLRKELAIRAASVLVGSKLVEKTEVANTETEATVTEDAPE